MRLPLVAALAVSAVLLASCGSTASTSASSVLWSSGSVKMMVPKTWTPVASKDVIVPAQGMFVLGMRGLEKYGEFENLNVVADDLAVAVSSGDYADTNFSLMSAKLASETPLGTKSVTFADSGTGKIRTFEGKYNASTNVKRYVQTARVCGKKAYVATYTLSATTKDMTEYETLLKTFSCVTAAPAAQ